MPTPNKILVIRLSSLGDVVLTLPVYKCLRQAYPTASIIALVKEEFSDVLKTDPAISKVMTLRRGESLASLCHRVRAEGIDTVIDLHGNIRSRVVSAFSGASTVVRYKKAALARRLYVGWRWPSADLKAHTLDRYMATLRQLDPDNPHFCASQPSKILVIQTAFLGDAVLTTPLLSALKEQFPNASLSVLCTPQIRDIFERHPAVADVILFDKHGAGRSLKAQWQLIRQVAERGYDMAIIPHRSFTSALMAKLAGIPRRVGFSSSQGRWLMTETVPFQWGVHDVERNLALLKALGVRQSAGELTLETDSTAVETVRRRLAEEGVKDGQRLIGVNPGSVWATKRWLPAGFAAVTDRLIRELGAQVVFIGGLKDEVVMQEILGMMKEKPINWVGKTTLPELIAVIARCQAFLTNDSGPMHIAVARRVPTVALFGPTTRELGFFPYGSGHMVIEKSLECRPCGLHGADACPLGHFHCMKWITPDEVFDAMKRQLQMEGPLSKATAP